MRPDEARAAGNEETQLVPSITLKEQGVGPA